MVGSHIPFTPMSGKTSENDPCVQGSGDSSHLADGLAEQATHIIAVEPRKEFVPWNRYRTCYLFGHDSGHGKLGASPNGWKIFAVPLDAIANRHAGRSPCKHPPLRHGIRLASYHQAVDGTG